MSWLVDASNKVHPTDHYSLISSDGISASTHAITSRQQNQGEWYDNIQYSPFIEQSRVQGLFRITPFHHHPSTLVTIVEHQFENYVENYEFSCILEFSGEKIHYRRSGYGGDEPPTDRLRQTSFSCSIHTLTDDPEANSLNNIYPGSSCLQAY